MRPVHGAVHVGLCALGAVLLKSITHLQQCVCPRVYLAGLFNLILCCTTHTHLVQNIFGWGVRENVHITVVHELEGNRIQRKFDTQLAQCHHFMPSRKDMKSNPVKLLQCNGSPCLLSHRYIKGE